MNNSLIADPHQRRLLKKWGAILETGKKIVNESTKIALAQVLENTRNYYKMKGMLNEAGIHQADVTGVFGPEREESGRAGSAGSVRARTGG